MIATHSHKLAILVVQTYNSQHANMVECTLQIAWQWSNQAPPNAGGHGQINSIPVLLSRGIHRTKMAILPVHQAPLTAACKAR